MIIQIVYWRLLKKNVKKAANEVVGKKKKPNEIVYIAEAPGLQNITPQVSVVYKK